MDIYRNSVRDLVLNPEFRKWVLHTNPDSDKIWAGYLAQNPTAVQDVELARELLLDLFSNRYPLQDTEFQEIWQKVDTHTELEANPVNNQKVIPINHLSGTTRYKKRESKWYELRWIARIAAVLMFMIGLGFLANTLVDPEPRAVQPVPISFKVYSTPPGVKSSVTLGDGTKVLLNSGSVLRFNENIFPDKREVFLEGEAFFEVYHDPNSPFTVKTGNVCTTALGTSFNVRAYSQENLLISLLTGKIAIELPTEKQDQIILTPGESLKIQPEKGDFLKTGFDDDEVIGWTRKMIVFNNTELSTAIRTLENWYGVTFHYHNQPKSGMYLQGKFYNETLENVLDGLSYTAELNFQIEKNTVNITFKH